MTKIKDIISHLEEFAPSQYQESYDNSRLIVGNPEEDVTNVLISLDMTEEVVEEAQNKGCNLIVAHHPIVFKGLKSLTGKNYVERTVLSAIKKDIALYAIHTNLDNVYNGVNKKIADKISLINTEVLAPKQGTLSKLVTFVPKENTRQVLSALHSSGAGNIGDYTQCSFTSEGTGTFVPGANTNPHIGEPLSAEKVSENRLELVFPNHLESRIIKSLQQSHPYEEVAYYVTKLSNYNQEVGSGMIGELQDAMEPFSFLNSLKDSMSLSCVRHTKLLSRKVKRVAVCGGSGSFLLSEAKRKGADVFVTADFKYHEFFDAENDIIIADIGHYESEVFTKELICDILSKKFTNFALNLSEIVTNPISYL